MTACVTNEHPLIELRNADVWRGDNLILHDFALTIGAEESVAVLGPNGAGKSTLIHLITGALHVAAKQGAVARLFGEELWSQESLRRRIGLVAPEQAAFFDVEEEARDVVLSSLRGAFGTTRFMRFSREERARAEMAMERAGVAHFATRPYGQLSSGERRRFLLARALVHEPQVLVLDEPTTALDFPSTFSFIEVVRKLIREGHGVVWVTHHPAEIPPEMTRVILLKDRKVFRDGAPKRTLTSSALSELYGIPLKVRWGSGFCHVIPAGH